jgi:hypothetical protein
MRNLPKVGALTDPTVPPPPWQLRGEALLLFCLLPLTAARLLLPQEIKVIPVLPGKTLSVLYIANYTTPSTLEYQELIYAPAIGYLHGRVGAWLSHVYVDDPRSVAGGKAIWGLPKQLARFEGSWKEGRLQVEAEGQHVLIDWPVVNKGLALPVLAPILTVLNSVAAGFWTSGRARMGSCKATVQATEQSPLALFNNQTWRALFLHDLKLRIRAPG